MRRCFGFFLLLFSSWTFAQECTRYMIVDVFDEKTTRGVDNLKVTDFMAKLDGQAIPMVSATQSFNNRILVLMETTGFAEYPEIARVVRDVAKMAGEAPAGRQIAFGVFSERSVFTSAFLANPQSRAKAIDAVMAHEPSIGRQVALFDSLHEALLMFGEHQPGDTILLISDGYDNSSKKSGSDLSKELIASGVRLITAIRERSHIVGRDFKGIAREATYDLKIMTSRTGGAYRRGANEHSLEFAWSGYMIGVRMPAGLTKPKPLKLEIRDASGKPSKKAMLFHPFELAPCASSVATR